MGTHGYPDPADTGRVFRRCGCGGAKNSPQVPREHHYLLYPLFCILGRTCRWILILSSLDPLLGMFVIRLVLHNNLIYFGSPASTAFRSAFRYVSRPTAVALTELGTIAKEHLVLPI